MPNASRRDRICVQFTVAPPTLYFQSDVGRWRIRTEAAIGGARHPMSPRMTSARPRVPIILTSGVRAAKAGPRNAPYPNVTTPPNATATR
jgi:hypothetical protein